MSIATKICPSTKGFFFFFNLETTGMASETSRHGWVCRRREQIILGSCHTASPWSGSVGDIIRKMLKAADGGGAVSGRKRKAGVRENNRSMGREGARSHQI